MLHQKTDDRPKDYTKITALSSSALGRFKRVMLEGGEDFKGNEPYLNLGTNFHRSILEPHLELNEMDDELSGRLANMMVKAKTVKSLRLILSHEKTKVETFANGKLDIDGELVPFKGILDIQNSQFKMVADLKTTSATNDSQFDEAIQKYGYLKQAWIYLQLSGLDTFVFYAFQSKKPYNLYTRKYYLDSPEIQRGGQIVKDLTNQYIETYGKFWEA